MGFAQMANNNQVDPYKPYMNLSGFRNDNWKETYDTFDEHSPQTIDNPINSNPLINDCVDSPRYQEFIGKTIDRERLGFHVSDQPTTSGISEDYYKDLRKKYPAIRNNYPENVRDINQDQWENLYCNFFYKPSHAELYWHPRIRDMMADQYVLRDPSPYVKIVQQELSNMGYNLKSDENDPNNGIDGVLGSRTVKALNSLEDPDAFVEKLKPKLFESLRDEPKFQGGWKNRIFAY